jgi:hypothetical protein
MRPTPRRSIKRGALRQRITTQLAALGGAYGALKGAAGTGSAGQPNLVTEPDPLECHRGGGVPRAVFLLQTSNRG